MTDKCIVYGCQNHKHQGSFEGDLCAPCHRMLTTGEPKHGTTFVHDMEARILADADRIEKLEAEVARLREALEVFADDTNWFDATEDNIRYPAWRGPVDEPEEFARAALAEQETHQ